MVSDAVNERDGFSSADRVHTVQQPGAFLLGFQGHFEPFIAQIGGEIRLSRIRRKKQQFQMFEGDPFLAIARIAFGQIGMKIGDDRENHALILPFPRLKIPDTGSNAVSYAAHDSS